MKLGVLFSGGKDSTYAAWLMKKKGHDLICLISVESENKESFMFHTPSISQVEKQAEVMKIPLIVEKTKGKKEQELRDLEKAIKKAIKNYGIKGIVTGAVKSVYQESRIKKICDKFGIWCFNPLWNKDEWKLLEELVKEGFEIIIVGVFAYPFDNNWLERKINKNFIQDIKKIYNDIEISPAGEGGEFETLVLNCPLFKRKLEINDKKIYGEKNSWKMEVKLK
jgi:ABC transporter with metal-binding/Fe-S-binding domain ATP-binding protein